MPDPINWSLALPYFVAALAFGYLLGSIPFGLLITRFAGLGDIRKIGSGNIGSTNVLRTGNKGLAALTLTLDILKGTAAVLIGGLFGPDTAIIAGLGAFLGHLFPIWLKFKGGKGVATYLGILLGLYWPMAFVFAAVWIAVAALSRYSSAAGMTAAIVSPFGLWFFREYQASELFFLLALLILWAHRENIARLLKGEESRIGQKSS
jgi:acyl phosphate:glycerol-3-phosphate acyltransferase